MSICGSVVQDAAGVAHATPDHVASETSDISDVSYSKSGPIFGILGKKCANVRWLHRPDVATSTFWKGLG